MVSYAQPLALEGTAPYAVIAAPGVARKLQCAQRQCPTAPMPAPMPTPAPAPAVQVPEGHRRALDDGGRARLPERPDAERPPTRIEMPVATAVLPNVGQPAGHQGRE